jgi:hypothetical protein
MVTTENSYDDATNTMTVGSTENCSTSAINTQHNHSVHIVIKNVEDLIGWQARVNYLGDKMRPNTVNFIPFLDNNTAQNISFGNLPIDQAALVHRDLITASSIPAAAPGPQTAAFGSSYIGVQDYAISPDTPAKAIPDDSSYSAPSGGVLAQVNLAVQGDQTGNQLFMNLDDGSPNGPGSGIAYFNGTTSQTVDLPSSALGDGFHSEGVPCVPQDCTTVECPPVTTPTPSPTATPTVTPTPTQTVPPTPTPTPTASTNCPSSPTPTPTGPQSVTRTFTNGTGETASDMHARFDSPVYPDCIVSNAPGCPSPSGTTFYGPPPARPGFNLDWGTACVDPGESVTVRYYSDSPGPLRCLNWTSNGAAIGSDCDATPTLTPTASPTLTPTPSTPTPTPTLTNEPCPDPSPTGCDVPRSVTFVNTTGQSASDLHFILTSSSPNVGGAAVTQNAPGCPAPAVGFGRTSGPNYTFAGDVIWSSACVDNGESVTVTVATGGLSVTVQCYHWTIFGSPIATPCSTSTATPTATPTPSPTPTPAGHDSRLSRISGVSRNVRLSPGGAVSDTANVVVANQSAHTDTIGVYVDVMAPAAGGCTPNGRVLQTTVTLAAGAKTTIAVPVSYSCADPAAANGLSFTWMAVADHGADDLASCGPGTLQGVACFDALASDDEDPADNRATRNGPRVIAQ